MAPQLLLNGVSGATTQGYSTLKFSPSCFKDITPKEEVRLREIILKDNNPLLNRLFDLFKIEGSIHDVVEESNHIVLRFQKPNTVTDSFISDGYFKLSK